MVADCVYSDACVYLVVNESGLVKFMKDVSFIGLQIKTCAPVAKVTVEHMTWDKQCFLQGGKELRSVTAAAVGAAPIELFPDSKVPVARKSTSTLEKGLQALKGQTKRSVSGSLARRRAPSAALGARRRPNIVDYSSASGSSSSNDGSGDSRIQPRFQSPTQCLRQQWSQYLRQQWSQCLHQQWISRHHQRCLGHHQ